MSVIAFPGSTVCPTCGRSCHKGDLSECNTCGKQYCRFDKWDCPCDPLTLKKRLYRLLPESWQPWERL